jgi:hypothetical protein
VNTAFVGGTAPTYSDLIGPLVHDDIRQSKGIYLTPINFVAPPFGTFGELTRNAFHGPGVNNFNLGLLKNVYLGKCLGPCNREASSSMQRCPVRIRRKHPRAIHHCPGRLPGAHPG